MAQNRSTANSETYNDITLTVAPQSFNAGVHLAGVSGAVGVNTPNPENGTFEISNVAVRAINTPAPNGTLSSSFIPTPTNLLRGQFYREGSRVYMEGAITAPTSPSYGLTSRIMTLPFGFRPLDTLVFNVAIDMSRAPVTTFAENFLAGQLTIDPNGQVKLQSIFSNTIGDVTVVDPSNTLHTGWQANPAIFLQGLISFSGISFRCTD